VQREPPRDFPGNLVAKLKVRDRLVLVNNAVLLEDIGSDTT
jgi:hypothetical protein